MLQKNQIHKIALTAYVVFLLWLVLFKFSANPFAVVADYQSRSLNLIPFAGHSGTLREMAENFVFFVPLGLLLAVNFKRVDFWRKVTYVFVLSVVVEIVQLIFAIGSTDITDVITNTLGGLVGLAAYRWVEKYVNSEKLDQVIAITFAVLLVVFGLLRFLVFRVRY